MANTGNIFCGTGENNAGIGATAWVNPGNIVSDNATDSTCTAAASSQYLVARNFNFSSVPANATIAGIVVRIEASESSTGAETLNAKIQDDTGALVGDTKTNSINGTGKTVYTYGTISDVWTSAPTGSKVHDADWGVRFWYTTAHNIAVDFVTMQLEYTIPGPGIATETDTAFALGASKSRAVGVATETDTAFALERESGFEGPVGLSTEADTAFALTASKSRALGLSTETDTAFGLTASKSRALGLSSEADTAFALSSGAGFEGPVGLATEADSAFALTASKSRALGLSTELDTAFAFVASKFRAVGMATETDTAFALSSGSGIELPVGMATHSNIALCGRCQVGLEPRLRGAHHRHRLPLSTRKLPSQ